MSDYFVTAIETLIRKAPAGWLKAVCETLRRLPPNETAEVAIKSMPATNNAGLSFHIGEVFRMTPQRMSWEALSWAIDVASICHDRWQTEQRVEFLWAGPSPANQLPARRIDQSLYDLIAQAQHEILLITFAASRIERLAGFLVKAAQRGVHIQLILEFEQSSEGQLSYDALKAFPQHLIDAVKVFHWPIEKRQRNKTGRPGKLHAKIAIVDSTVLVSSANLTDDAFNRNLEVGILVDNPNLNATIKSYLESLMADGTLCRM